MKTLDPKELTKKAEEIRVKANDALAEDRGKKGQFFTPIDMAHFMSRMFHSTPGEIRLLDAGAGSGILTAAFVEFVLKSDVPPKRVSVTAYENDAKLLPFLRETLELVGAACRHANVDTEYELIEADFIERAATEVGTLFGERTRKHNIAIMNPPYLKIRSASPARMHLRQAGIETSNLYSGFVALALLLLEKDAQLVAITPRSFCNGPYFRPFREHLLRYAAIERIHVFNSRNAAFKESKVLQENVIIHVCAGGSQGPVVISSSSHATDPITVVRSTPIAEVVYSNDHQRFIHLPTNEISSGISRSMGALPCTLEDLKIEISTGRVVDFRAKSHLRMKPEGGTVPLIYPGNIRNGFVQWPKNLKNKAQAIRETDETATLFLENGIFVLTKRFTSKEERRRVVAALSLPEHLPGRFVGFENHLNVYHQDSRGLAPTVARGLAVFLNSTTVDEYFRLFNGHTQVNATDLRSLRYPSLDQLESLGRKSGGILVEQAHVDAIVHEVVFSHDAVAVKRRCARQRLEEARDALSRLASSPACSDEKSALVLLALCNVKPSSSWRSATRTKRTLQAMLTFIGDTYGTRYEIYGDPEKLLLGPLIEAGLVVQNNTNGGAVFQLDAATTKYVRALRREKNLARPLVKNSTKV